MLFAFFRSEAFTRHVIRSNQDLSLDDNGGKEREPGFEVASLTVIASLLSKVDHPLLSGKIMADPDLNKPSFKRFIA